VPRWAPASLPWAQTRSAPEAATAPASSTVVAVPTRSEPASWRAGTATAGSRPKVKLVTGTRSSATTASWASKSSAQGPVAVGRAGRPSSIR